MTSQTNRFPFTITAIKGSQWTSPTDSNLRILFGIRGSWQILTDEKLFNMSQEDLIVLNVFQTAQLTAETSDAIFFVIEIFREQVEAQLNFNWQPIFECNSMEQQNFAYQKKEFSQLREKLLACLASFYEVEGANNFSVYERFFALLSYLRGHFQQAEFEVASVYDSKIQQVLDIIQKNYQQPLSLQTIAEQTFLSYHYLSRKFKDEVGTSFKEYLTAFRLEQAARQLLLSNQSILTIALENGFTNSKAFHAAFKKHFQMTPRSFRESQAQRTTPSSLTPTQDDFQLLDLDEAIAIITSYIVEKDPDDLLEPLQIVKKINVGQLQASRPALAKILNIGDCFHWLRADVKESIIEAITEIDFSYLRFNDVIIENNLTIDTFDILPEYSNLRSLLSFCQKWQLIPIIQLKFPEFPANLTSAEVKELAGEWLAPRIKILQKLADEMNTAATSWHFEFQIEPLSAFSGELFLQLYQQLQRIIEQPQIGINLGASYQSKAQGALEHFLADCHTRQLKLSFFSYHSDPTVDYLWDDLQQNMLENFQEYNFATVKTLIEKYQFNGKILLSEWNTLIGKGTILRGTFFRAAILLKDLLNLSGKIAGVGFFLNNDLEKNREDIIDSTQNRLTLFVGYQLKRPAFFTLKLFGRTKGQLIYQDQSIWLFKEQRCYHLLLLNPAYFNPAMSIDQSYMQYQSRSIHLQLSGLTSGSYQLKTISLDKDHGGIYNDILKTGGMETIDQEALIYLKQKIQPRLELAKVTIANELSFKELLSFNACRLIDITPLHF